MTKRILFFAIILLTTFGCDEINQLTQFEMEFNESITIDSTTVINQAFDISTSEISSNAASLFETNNTSIAQIEQIVLTSLDLTLSIPDDGDFSFLKTIEIYISADSLDELKLAWKYDIPSDVADYIELDTAGEDFKEYLIQDEFSLRLNTITDETITTDHQIDIHTIFFVDGNILGE